MGLSALSILAREVAVTKGWGVGADELTPGESWLFKRALAASHRPESAEAVAPATLSAAQPYGRGRFPDVRATSRSGH